MTTPTPTDRSHDVAQIRQIMAEQVRAMRERDAAYLVSRYTPDARKFSLAPPLQSTGAEVRDEAALRNWFAGFDGPIEYEIRDLVVTAGEDVAFCHSLNRLSTTPRGAPRTFDLWFRATVGFLKVEGTWRIAHEHISTPFYMDATMRAAVDLKP